MKHFVILCLLSLIHIKASSQNVPLYKDKSRPVDERVNDLIGRMTSEEKFFQLFMIPGDIDNLEPGQFKHGIFGLQVSTAGNKDNHQMLSYHAGENALILTRKINSIQKYFVEKTRLGIPIIPFDEALHGLVRGGATSFPQAIALSSSFDTTLVSEVAKAIAMETKARGIRQVLSPVVNIATDVRWGRTEETYGEDPFLASAMAVAYVKAFEKNNIITTPKHFVANVGDGGRDSYPIHVNERLLEEIHFPPFKACIELGGSRSLMTSYNSVDGTPATSNDWLLQKKLKHDWEFGGFVVSDASATGGSIVLHDTSPDFPTAAQQAISNGLDVIFQTEYRHHTLFDAPFRDGRISQERIDDAVARVLRAKFQLGLFENPYVSEDNVVSLSKSKANKELARKAALESIVLLKNSGSVLPLTSNVKTVAVIGEVAKLGKLGGYSGPGNGVINILDGISNRKSVKVAYALGATVQYKPWTVIPGEYLSNEAGAGLKGEYFNNLTLLGSPAVSKIDRKIDFLWTLSSPDTAIKKDFYSVRWTGRIKSPRAGKFKIGLTGNDGFRLFIDNEIVIDNWVKRTFSTITADFTFEQNKSYDLRIEFFEPVGNASLKLIWNADYKDDWNDKIKEAVLAAQTSDVAIIVAGIHEGEFQDRAMLSLPGYQEELIREVSATGKPTVVILTGGSAITMNNWINNVDAIVDVWYPGEEGGNAVADILFGDYNPAGRLPITFPVHEAQLPLAYNHKPTGRGDDYSNLTGLPLFPFGYGLSYTTFEYSGISLDDTSISTTATTTVRCTVKNIGARSGDEVIQLYVKDVLASVARPVMELKGFQRIRLDPGESKEVVFQITPAMLSMLNAQMQSVVEPGDFRIMIGSSSRDIRLKTTLEVTR